MLAVVCGILGAVLGQFLSGPLLRAIHTPGNVLDSAVLYLRIYFLGYPFLMLYDFGSAILRSKGDSRRPFLALTVSGVINVLLNLFLVVVCRLGVAGVAIATDLATGFSAFMVLYWLTKEPDEFHLSLRDLRISRQNLLSILVTGIPALSHTGKPFCGFPGFLGGYDPSDYVWSGLCLCSDGFSESIASVKEIWTGNKPHFLPEFISFRISFKCHK